MANKLKILNIFEDDENYKNNFKNINIANREEALIFLKNQTSSTALFYAYSFSLIDELKSDEEIYDYLKEKFISSQDSSFQEYSRNFVHEYGEICGKTDDKNKIDFVLSEVKNFISKEQPYYGYWMFYSLICNTKINFETYLEIYKLFADEISIQGSLLVHYRNINKQNAKDYEMIRLLNASSDECIKENWFLAVNCNFFSTSLYHVLLRRNVSKEKLDKLSEEYFELEKKKNNQEIDKQTEKAKCLIKEKRKKWWNRLK